MQQEKKAPAWRKWVFLALRIALSLGLVAWALSRVPFSELKEILLGLDRRLFALFFPFIGVIIFISAFRWRMLLGVQGVHISPGEAIRLTFVGIFFNNVVPGLTGGDVVKAYYISRRTRDKKVEAVVTVFLDRAIGLVALVSLALVVILANLGEERTRQVLILVLGFLCAVLVGAVIFFSRRLRRVFKIEVLLEKLPSGPISRVVRSIDRAILLYRDHRLAVLAAFGMSLGMHLIACTCNAGFGYALGMRVAPKYYFIFFPVISMVSTIPITIAGWGVGERSYQFFFESVDVSAGHGLALSVLYRISSIFIWSLPGAVLLAVGGKPTSAQVEEELAREASDEAPRDK